MKLRPPLSRARARRHVATVDLREWPHPRAARAPGHGARAPPLAPDGGGGGSGAAWLAALPLPLVLLAAAGASCALTALVFAACGDGDGERRRGGGARRPWCGALLARRWGKQAAAIGIDPHVVKVV